MTMRMMSGILAAGAALVVAGGANAATVEVREAVARVVVIPEARNDIKVEILTTNPALPIEVKTRGSEIVIDGGLGNRITSCSGSAGKESVHVRGQGKVAYADMPQVVIRTPRDVHVRAGGAVFGSVGKSDNLTLSSLGCGNWTIANVTQDMHLNLAGSGDMATGTAASAVLNLSGSGDLLTKAIHGPLSIKLAGSGDIAAASADGTLQVSLAGSGDIVVSEGRASEADLNLAGSGDISFGGTAETLKARIVGSGDIHVHDVTGPVSKAVVGSGEIHVGT
jgi:hypothetical protein